MSVELELADMLAFATPVALTSLSLATAHWFPWHGGTKIIRRPTAYAIGTAIVVGVPVVTMLLCEALGRQYSQLFWAALLTANVAVGGATVNLAYWIDSRLAVSLDDVAEAGHATQRR
jgi:hypothetical protein